MPNKNIDQLEIEIDIPTEESLSFHEKCNCDCIIPEKWDNHESCCPVWKNGRIKQLEEELKRSKNEAIEVIHDLSAKLEVRVITAEKKLKKLKNIMSHFVKEIDEMLPEEKTNEQG